MICQKIFIVLMTAISHKSVTLRFFFYYSYNTAHITVMDYKLAAAVMKFHYVHLQPCMCEIRTLPFKGCKKKKKYIYYIILINIKFVSSYVVK